MAAEGLAVSCFQTEQKLKSARMTPSFSIIKCTQRDYSFEEQVRLFLDPRGSTSIALTSCEKKSHC